MHLVKKLFIVGNVLALLAFFSTGCTTTTISEDDTAYVYIAENGTITYHGELYSAPNEVAKKLLADGATPSTLIMLIPQGTIPTIHMKEISNVFGRKGLSHVVIRDQKKVTSSIQQRGTGIAEQPPASVPKMKNSSRGRGRSSGKSRSRFSRGRSF